MKDNVKSFTTEIAKTSFFLSIGNIISTILLAVTTIIIGSILGPDKYGLYMLVQSIPFFLASIVDLGLTASVLYFSAKYRDRSMDKALSYLFTGMSTTSLIALSVTIFLFLFPSLVSS
ncbi:MAG TPA: hypothetical protein ENG40_04280, partial [Thermoprotei archaeon]|nr:hypothetical protein [Thermoprotei archaeon]